MNGVHDMGGMHGFGKVEPDADERPFHAEWEAQAFAMALALQQRGLFTWSEWAAALVTRDCMIGMGLPRTPAKAAP